MIGQALKRAGWTQLTLEVQWWKVKKVNKVVHSGSVVLLSHILKN